MLPEPCRRSPDSTCVPPPSLLKVRRQPVLAWSWRVGLGRRPGRDAVASSPRGKGRCGRGPTGRVSFASRVLAGSRRGRLYGNGPRLRPIRGGIEGSKPERGHAESGCMYPERSASCQLRETGGVVRGSGLSAPVDGLGSARPAVASRPDSRRSGSWLGGVCASLRAPYDGHGLARAQCWSLQPEGTFFISTLASCE